MNLHYTNSLCIIKYPVVTLFFYFFIKSSWVYLVALCADTAAVMLPTTETTGIYTTSRNTTVRIINFRFIHKKGFTNLRTFPGLESCCPDQDHQTQGLVLEGSLCLRGGFLGLQWLHHLQNPLQWQRIKHLITNITSLQFNYILHRYFSFILCSIRKLSCLHLFM